ncbi:MAG: hypothetical protein UY72_C0025G0012 [Candidatus Uhrbacteria bacterium GW2011_GWD2_52_7]|uniref:Uncharacterized protein n=1 Tax=Candidatus Uhrbacteria bacterium GW2011_GWD2_52_7 TaxID=1618989 RepID=A0A0G1XGG2_9BACT|nr:MAG: hypothetical protein UY72_C0025G0012 [Candidatus Uhrbacteria bacterium GW2011_GWD2_52_7]
MERSKDYVGQSAERNELSATTQRTIAELAKYFGKLFGNQNDLRRICESLPNGQALVAKFPSYEGTRVEQFTQAVQLLVTESVTQGDDFWKGVEKARPRLVSDIRSERARIMAELNKELSTN